MLRLNFLTLLLSLLYNLSIQENNIHKSPLYQYLPDCKDQNHQNINRIVKKTDSKALLCPMFKDEEGFLAEWVSYYQIHGIDHIRLYDDDSSDHSIKELKPWIESGFVTIRSNWTWEINGFQWDRRASKYYIAMYDKAVKERECKLWGIQNNFNYFFSVDIDEYMVVAKPGVSIVDSFENFISQTGRVTYMMSKYNFQSTPHLLEPIDLLVIEAFQTRMHKINRMNYYTTTMRKFATMLVPPESLLKTSDDRKKLLAYWGFDSNNSTITSLWIASCCNFHGCNRQTPKYMHHVLGDTYCKDNMQEEWRVNGKGKKWKDAFQIYHYARSLEKFALKSRTWKTSSGEGKNSYELPTFFSRSVGWYHDPTALQYSCQVREQLAKMDPDNFTTFIRPGDFWYRNLEFGRHVSDPEKRGRYGRPSNIVKFNDGNLYHYEKQPKEATKN